MGMVRGSAGRVFDHRIRGVEGPGVTRQTIRGWLPRDLTEIPR
jgi:hypothetical protein